MPVWPPSWVLTPVWPVSSPRVSVPEVLRSGLWAPVSVPVWVPTSVAPSRFPASAATRARPRRRPTAEDGAFIGSAGGSAGSAAGAFAAGKGDVVVSDFAPATEAVAAASLGSTGSGGHLRGRGFADRAARLVLRCHLFPFLSGPRQGRKPTAKAAFPPVGAHWVLSRKALPFPVRKWPWKARRAGTAAALPRAVGRLGFTCLFTVVSQFENRRD